MEGTKDLEMNKVLSSNHEDSPSLEKSQPKLYLKREVYLNEWNLRL